jgi:hypothetical protein
LKDVRVFTFDEVLTKMKTLLALLTPAPEQDVTKGDGESPF